MTKGDDNASNGLQTSRINQCGIKRVGTALNSQVLENRVILIGYLKLAIVLKPCEVGNSHARFGSRGEEK